MKLENIVPWGRNLNEYKAMFLLNETDLKNKILGCGDGPLSFNTEVDMNDGSVVSIDPLYQFSKKEIMQLFEEKGYSAEIVKTAYEFQKGANEMLKITKQ